MPPADPTGPSRTDDYGGALRPILERAGDAALARFGRAASSLKPDGSQVTDADRAAEEVIVEGLTRLFPDDAVISEEGARSAGRPGGGTWYVDPIDGTGAYLEGLAYWGPTVALARGGTLILGALLVPRVKEFWYAERGAGAWRDGSRLSPVDPGPPRHDHSIYLPSRYHRRMPIDWPGKVRALGSSAAHLALVASGGAVATVVPRWETWDIGCGILLVEEAGRIVTTLAGEALDPLGRPGEGFLAGTPAAIRYLSERLAPR